MMWRLMRNNSAAGSMTDWMDRPICSKRRHHLVASSREGAEDQNSLR